MAPLTPSSGDYIYDHEDNDDLGCGQGGTVEDGVNIRMLSTAYINTELDQLFDDENGNACGRIQWNTTNNFLSFLIDADGTF